MMDSMITVIWITMLLSTILFVVACALCALWRHLHKQYRDGINGLDRMKRHKKGLEISRRQVERGIRGLTNKD